MRQSRYRAWNGESMSKPWEPLGSDAGDIWVFLDEEMVPVDSDSLIWMEYTGLKDKNGKDIVESDWFRSDLGEGEVIFENGSFWVFERKRPGIAKYALHELGNAWGHFPENVPGEVIGNIHENPELL